jgi:hypothetical protein
MMQVVGLEACKELDAGKPTRAPRRLFEVARLQKLAVRSRANAPGGFAPARRTKNSKCAEAYFFYTRAKC